MNDSLGIKRFAIAFLATIAVSSGHAVEIPGLPLQTGAAYPPANVMFILDDSGSMVFEKMPGDQPSGWRGYNPLADTLGDKASDHNTIYYDPAEDYLPWMTADKIRMTGGTSYGAAYADLSMAAGPTVDLADAGSCREVDMNGSDYEVCGGTQTFFVRKAAGQPTNDNQDYYRYQIRRVAGATRVVRSEWLRPGKGNEGVKNAGCDDDNGNREWRNCTFAVPGDRSEAEELTNFATWFSYHRTRIKVAKSGASEAFGQMGDSVRVGYDSIWNRNSNAWSRTSSVSDSATPAYPIPVGTNEGRFSGTNRSDWFAQVQGARGYNGTPLHGALQRSGRYFEDDGANGPWGPGNDPLSCRQNFAILTTDGYWNSNSGYTSVGDSDGTAGKEIVSEDGKSTFQYKPVAPYRDDFSSKKKLYSRGDTLADIANYYWKRDLVETLANDVPTSTADPAFWQHMVTFGVSIGLRGRLDPKTDLQSITNGSKHWGDPTDDEDLDRIDDLWHASVNGHGNFVTASSPGEFVQGLIDALSTVAQRLGSASNVTANSTSFQTDTRVYQASYVSGKWTGELAAYEVSSAGVSNKDADGDGVPDAAWKASQRIPSFGARKIFTSSASGIGKGVAFPTAGQLAALAQDSRPAINGGPTTGQQNADYIAGSQALETRQGGTLRDRDSLLGDIANSSPMYVQDNEMIYVGANDGMLHAFSAKDGREVFAYVPAGIDFAALGTLSDPKYGPAHRYFVDGPVTVTSQAQAGKNYLVATLGRGGNGIFALDVTNPDKFKAGNVLWDLTGSALGNDMGRILGEPLIVTLNDEAATRAVIVGNGINSANGHSVLFVLDLATGAVIRKFDTGSGGDNGLSAPRGADVDGNGTVDRVYAGDLNGNIWKFDLSASIASDWNIANNQAMFTATDADGTAQPITAGLAIARNPATNSIWVFGGTGSFIESGDITDNGVQSLYALVDDGLPIPRSDLTKREIITVGISDAGNPIRGFEQSGTLPTGARGWYVDLDYPVANGERVVSNPRVQGTVLLAASLVPPDTGTCNAGGNGFINALDAFTGTSLSTPYFDVNNDGKYDDEDRMTDADGNLVAVGSIDLGVGMPTLPTLIEKLLVVGGSKGTLGSISMNPQGGAAQRISWREIVRD